MGQQNFNVINLDGGLNLVDTHYTLQQRLGTCKQLDNYESTIEGGYRRIDGYTRFGTAQPSGGANQILGVFPYADGVVAVSSTGIYFSTDGITWVQVNRDTYTAATGTVAVANGSGTYIDVAGTGTSFTTEFAIGDVIKISGNYRQVASITDNTTMTITEEISGGVAGGTTAYYNGTTSLSGTVLPRTSQGQSEFAWLEDDGTYGSIVITDTTGNNNAARFKVLGSGGAREYFYDDLTEAGFGCPSTPRHCTTFQQRVVVADLYQENQQEQGTVAWSDRYSNQWFQGASAGTVQVDSPVVAVKPFRDRLIIFCKNSIYQLTEINTPANTQVLPISYTTGCASAASIQELAGDIIFLSYDGLRVLTASDKYGDVDFGIISSSIDPYIKSIVNNITNFRVSSCIIRNKNQYRLFYTDANYDDSEQYGVIGTFKRNAQGGTEWQWSRIRGIPVSALANTANTFISGNKEEKIFHGAYDGYVYQHDTGEDFNGAAISSVMSLNEVDYGDAGLKKTLHYVKVFGSIEGTADDMTLQITYDYGSSRTMQPGTHTFSIDIGLSKYGTAQYGVDVFAGTGKFLEQVNVEGSGFTNDFTLISDGTGAPYSINSLYVDVRLGAKQ